MNVLHWLVLHGPMSVKIPVLVWALIDCLPTASLDKMSVLTII